MSEAQHYPIPIDPGLHRDLLRHYPESIIRSKVAEGRFELIGDHSGIAVEQNQVSGGNGSNSNKKQ